MQPVTFEAVQAKQTELATMIQQLQSQAPRFTSIEVEGCTIILQPGERYAGMVLDEEGQHKHHLVLMSKRPAGKLNWQAAIDWATRVGGAIPTSQELSLLFANCKPNLQAVWHWSSETYEDDASFAWYCCFDFGHVYYRHESYEGSAVAVRRV